MKTTNFIKIAGLLSLLSCGRVLHGNIIWPAIFVAEGIMSSGVLILISIAIEALLLYVFLKHISLLKAFMVSLVGNMASAIIGTIFMALAMLMWHGIFDEILGGTFSTYSIITNYILMYLGSSIIELVTIKEIFKYPLKQLWLPVFAGNFITYVLVYFFRFHQDFIAIINAH